LIAGHRPADGQHAARHTGGNGELPDQLRDQLAFAGRA
jgi:hypothetical protein